MTKRYWIGMLVAMLVYYLGYGYLLEKFNPLDWRGNIIVTFLVSLFLIYAVFGLLTTLRDVDHTD